MFAWIVTPRNVLMLALTVGCCGGCGSGEEAPPPASDSVTTEPLDIELPGPGEASGPATSPDVKPADEAKTTP